MNCARHFQPLDPDLANDGTMGSVKMAGATHTFLVGSSGCLFGVSFFRAEESVKFARGGSVGPDGRSSATRNNSCGKKDDTPMGRLNP